MNASALFFYIIRCILIAIVVIIYVRITKYKEVNVNFNNIRLTTILALIAIMISIHLTILYNLYFTTIFPLNTILNIFIIKLILSIPAIITIIINKESLKSIGFTDKNLLKSIIIGFIAGFIFFFTTNIKSFSILIHINLQSIKVLNHLFLYYCIVGLGEEFLYRGYLQTRLIYWCGQKRGWILSSLIFAFIHLSQRIIIDKIGLIQAFLSCATLLPMSLLLGYIMIKTKHLISCVILHSFIDWTSIIINYI